MTRRATPPLTVVLHDIRSLYNVGAFFRTADGAGIDRLVLSGITARPPRKEIAKTALGAELTVPWCGVDDIASWMDAWKAGGGQLAAVETGAVALDLYDWSPRWPLALCFGHEVDGLPDGVLDRCDLRVQVPMLGMKRSLNVATAGGVVMYEVLRKWRAAG